METKFDIRCPIGKIEEQAFSKKSEFDHDTKLLYIRDIEDCPAKLEISIVNLNDDQLNAPYRENGWTPMQIIHHVADSHMNGFIRFKLALTEENPTVKTYNQSLWASLPDSNLRPATALSLLKALHEK